MSHTSSWLRNKKGIEKQNWREHPQDRSNRCANFQLKRSKDKVTGRQKPPENDAYLTYLVLTYGSRIVRWRLCPLHTRHSAMGGWTAACHVATKPGNIVLVVYATANRGLSK